MTVELVFWSSIALALYAYAGYPCALMALAAVRRRAVRRRPITPPVSLIITVHNEEARIGAKLANALEQDYPAERLEIIVASDCSTDGTDAIAGGFAPRVRLLRAETRRGKEAAQRMAIEAAAGDILVFSDAATGLAPDGITSIVANFADPEVGCVSSVDRFVDPDGRVSGEGAYVRYEMFLRRLETRANSVVGLSGSFFAARREVCRRWPTDRPSDFNTVLNTVDLGLRAVLDAGSIGYYANLTDDRRELQRKIRTVARGMNALAAVPRMLNPFRYGMFAWQLASHKVCRWLVPFAMIAAAASNTYLAATVPFYGGMLAAQCAFYAAALAGLWSGAPALRIPAFLLLANAGVLIAWLRVAHGDRCTVWTPSARPSFLPVRGPR